MTWRVRVRHTTGYRYDSEVTASYNEARLVPQTGPTQLTLESTVETVPRARQQRYWDYWGTQVTSFDVHTPHTELEVTAVSVVETADATPPPVDCTWELLRSDPVRDEHVELLVPSPRAVADATLLAVVDEVAGLTPYETMTELIRRVREHVAYRPGSTGVSTNAVEAWQLGAGVCQDIAHVSLALLRLAGIPARYVSGYLHPGGSAAAIGETVRGESHAWVEAYLGAWYAFDPTNGVPAGERHVVVARGRDYADVTPLKGVYAGGGSQSLGVVVEVTRLA
ncbi:MAG TPA: transglutaminase family protein [Mycobacteriales bacterium]|jgi:transglutaminase-like putative cysteine protease|nr:transglutaminase family protein [Mycobacteriales bacterium]